MLQAVEAAVLTKHTAAEGRVLVCNGASAELRIEPRLGAQAASDNCGGTLHKLYWLLGHSTHDHL